MLESDSAIEATKAGKTVSRANDPKSRGWGQSPDLFTDYRNRGLRYSQEISDALNNELAQYVDDSWNVTDICDEIALLRHMLGETLVRYEAIGTMPEATPEEQAVKLEANRIVRKELWEGTKNVITACKTMAEIQSMRKGRMDAEVVGNLLSVILSSLDAGFREFAKELSSSGISPERLIEAISDRVLSACHGQIDRVAGEEGTNIRISSEPTAISAEELLAEMLSTIPLAPERKASL